LYSWEKKQRSGPRKPIYLRWWFYTPIALLALGAVVVWVGWIYISVQYEKKAQAFDLSQLEKMEAASVIYDREGTEMAKSSFKTGTPSHSTRCRPSCRRP